MWWRRVSLLYFIITIIIIKLIWNILCIKCVQNFCGLTPVICMRNKVIIVSLFFFGGVRHGIVVLYILLDILG